MAVFELVIALLFVGAALSALARRAKLPYPALLALAGAALALLPHIPSVKLDPELALTLFVAPVLLDAAFDTSPRDLKRYWRPVTGLALAAVVLTVVAVAWVARYFEPKLSWPAAIALGAIVAPPDAAAASAVLKQLRLPHRLLVILEGESLFNDASALLIYRVAVAQAVSVGSSLWQDAPIFLLGSLASVPLGLALAWLVSRTLTRVEDVSLAVIVQFLSTFAVWMLAERLHLSGIITMVVFAIALSRSVPERTPARLRVPAYAVWEVVVFVLNVLAFMLVGLQLKPILRDLSSAQLRSYLSVAAAVCAAVILVRIVWVMLYEAVARWGRARSNSPPAEPASQAAVLVAWTGMRGIVTLATALALPLAGAGFPQRDLLLFTAFSVVLVTLVLQGLTLSPMIKYLRLRDDGVLEREVRLARKRTAEAGLHALGEQPAASTAEGEPPRAQDDATLIRQKYEARLRWAGEGSSAEEPPPGARFHAAQQRALGAERQQLSELRATGVIGDDAYHRIEEELDWAELDAATALQVRN